MATFVKVVLPISPHLRHEILAHIHKPLTHMSNEAPSSPPNASAQDIPTSPTNPLGVGKAQFLAILALLNGASFFFPWIKFLFGTLSGLEFAKTGGVGVFLWFWPVFSATTIWLAITGKSCKFAGQMAGAAPFVVFAYTYFHERNFRFVDNIAGGGWLALACGAVLFVCSRR